ncbi:MAG: DUF1735 domain-containing protein [Tenuifilaceae bacterium]
MKKLNIFKITAFGFMLAMLAVSCIPESDIEPAGDKGTTFIKITPAEFKLIAVDAKNEEQKAVLFEIRKDAKSAASLAMPTSVTLTLDINQTMIDAYNIKNETHYELMPTTLYSTNYTPTADGTISIDFAAGEHTKTMWITIPNASAFDFSKSYALAYKIAVSGEGVYTAAASDTMVCQVLAKNKYDGLYLLKGMHNRVPYTFPYETEMELHTMGASSVGMYWPEVGSIGHPIGLGPDNDLSWYGSAIAPVVVMDPLTDMVASVFNQGGATVITKFTDAGVANSNKYDPVTKTLYVSWNYNNNPLRAFIDTFTYLGPR